MALEVETVRIEASESLPEDTTFEAYVENRMKEAQDFAAAPEETPDESPDLDKTPEPAESAPAAEEITPAAETPEPVTEPGTVETNQEEKDKEKKQGIPQSRLDEVTKARREAERKLEAETATREKLERELAELKAKPAETKPTEPAPAEIAEPAAPETPTLEDPGIDGDWEKWQKATAEYNKTTYPKFLKELTVWTQNQIEAQKQKQTAEKAETDKKAKAEADQKANVDLSNQEYADRISAAKDKYPDWEEVISTDAGGPMHSPAMEVAIRGFKDAGDIIYYLGKNPEESKRIAAMTPHQDGLPSIRYSELLATATEEFLGIRTKLKGQVAAPPATETTPVTPPAPKPPENPKPATSRAPRPPTPVTENAGSGVKTPKDAAIAGDFDSYVRTRQPQLTRR